MFETDKMRQTWSLVKLSWEIFQINSSQILLKKFLVKKVESEGLTKYNKSDFKCAEEIM